MLKIGLLILAVLIVGLVLFIAARPDDFRVQRSVVVNAPVPVIFEQVNNLRKWSAWSPFERMDPGMKQTYEGPPAGPGASSSWAGEKSGEGKMTIAEARPNEEIAIRLEFVKPFAGTNDVDFTFKPEEGGTLVTWTMTGKNNFMSKAIGLVMNCEKMCGDQFDAGLAELKKVSEASTARN